jgi:hypothetical protein
MRSLDNLLGEIVVMNCYRRDADPSATLGLAPSLNSVWARQSMYDSRQTGTELTITRQFESGSPTLNVFPSAYGARA